jgi:glutathione synthase
LRVPTGGDIASNLHMGGTAQAAEITAQDRLIIEAIVPRLAQDGLYFVGIDVIGGYLTEINVTSPTGIQQISRFARDNKAKHVIDWLARKLG